MSKPKWGIKRICQSCGAKFYDLQSSPIICPGCGAKFDPDALLRGRRTRSTAAPKAAPVKVAEKPPEADAADGDEDSPEPDAVEVAEEKLDTDADKDLGDSGGENLIEDTSELGDDDDVSEVVAGAAEGDDEER
ncbi:MAG: TIGR02300 family protein [Kiloniellales bacterium]